MINCWHNIQLGPDDSVSFPAEYGAKYNVVSLFLCAIKKFLNKTTSSNKSIALFWLFDLMFVLKQGCQLTSNE